MLIELKNISFTYSKGAPFAKQALKDISLSVRAGEWVVLLGAPGSGKTTLLEHINGLLRPDCGEVLVDGVNIHSSIAELKKNRRKIGLLFQYPEHQIFGATVKEEISYGPRNFGYPPAEAETRVKKAMTSLGLDYCAYKERSPYELSGGEKRRLALAGIVACNPEILVLDEPTAGLDRTGKEMVIDTIASLHRSCKVTVVWATHNLDDVINMADNLVVLNHGRIAASGPIRETAAGPVLAELDLSIPLAVNIAGRLRKKGKPLTGNPLTLEEIKSEIINLIG